jgi:hypothetical protein
MMPVIEVPSRRMAELIPTLLEQTRAGAIGWMQTDLPGSFVHVSRSGSVAVRGPVGRDSERSPRAYSIRILDSRGETLESFHEETSEDSAAERSQLVDLVDEVIRLTWEGNPLIDKIREEISAARP